MRLPDPALLQSVRRRPCDNCGRHPPCHAAHILHGGRGDAFRVDHPWNVVALCIECHSKNHSHQITTQDLWKIAARREGKPPGEIEREIRRLRRLTREGKEPHHA